MKKIVIKYAITIIGLGLFTTSLAADDDWVTVRKKYNAMSPKDKAEYRARNLDNMFDEFKKNAAEMNSAAIMSTTVERLNQSTFKIVTRLSRDDVASDPVALGAMKVENNKVACSTPEIRTFMLDTLQATIIYAFTNSKGETVLSFPVNSRACAGIKVNR